MEGNRVSFSGAHDCPILCITKSCVFVIVAVFVLYLPLGDPQIHCSNTSLRSNSGALCCLCDIHKHLLKLARLTTQMVESLVCVLLDSLYQAKLKFYDVLEKIDGNDLCRSVCCSKDTVHSIEMIKESVDEVIEDEITQKLSEDLLQSIEKKFQIDLERSVDMVLVKIKMLLQNGTAHIQDKLVELQNMLEIIKNNGEKELEVCLQEHQAEASVLAEKALHQMVVCGYALIGHDPAQAVSKVIALKSMISQGVKPIYDQKKEVYGLLKACGHDHDTLKKVIKCVISKSPLIKSAMMEITGKLIEGVVDLTKLMAHGAMHEACLIEVIRTTEDDAFKLVKTVRSCVYGNETLPDIQSYIEENNATVLDIDHRKDKINIDENDANVKEMKSLIRRMLTDTQGKDLDEKIKKKLVKLQKDLGSANDNLIKNDVKNDKTDLKE